jgi:fatty acid desaturase
MTIAIPLTITDPVYNQEKSISRLSRFFASLLNDARNVPFIYYMLLIIVTTIPWAVILFIPGMFHWWLALPYFLFNSGFLMGTFILMQHNAAHKMLFKRKYKFLNNIIPWFLGPFFGLSPETYFAHHIGMHHPENNLLDDLSTTMKSRRDSFRDFMKYFFRFFIVGIPELGVYLKQKNRKRILINLVTGETLYLLFVFALLFVNWKADVAVFIIPMIFTRFMMMAGNWAQHAFIDKSAPENCFRNSITCINSSYNKKCWNDGYHIGHHLHPSMHWTDMPGEFQKNFEKYKSEDAVVFRRLDYFMIWFLLMTKSYGTLSTYFVELRTEHPRGKKEIIDLLKERTKRIVL